MALLVSVYFRKIVQIAFSLEKKNNKERKLKQEDRHEFKVHLGYIV